MKYNSVTEMIKSLSKQKFYFRWLQNRLDWLEAYENGIQSEWYSEYQTQARIYLDEYEGQKELREEWLRKRLEIDLINSQTFAEDSSELDITFETVSNLVSKINNKYSENYFTNRWLRRH